VTDRGTPERPTENPADHPTGNCADRTGNYKPWARSCRRTDHIGACNRRDRRHDRYRCYCKCKLTHGFPRFVEEGYPLASAKSVTAQQRHALAEIDEGIAANIAKLPELLRKPSPFNKDSAAGA
jgi:hypothetical protein